MVAKKSIVGQIENRNFLAPTGFKFQLNRTPKVTYFGNAVNIPSIDLGVAEQPTYLRDIPLPGDKLQFADFSLRFLVDEGLENYMEIQNWMRGLGFPESLKEIYDFQKGNPDISQPPKSQLNLYSDGTLTILNSNNVPKFKLIFENLFPESLKEIYDFQKGNPDISQPPKSQLNLYSDGTLTILNSNNIPKFKLIFENLFPISLTTLEFDATQTDLEYFTAEVTFKYTIYNIRDI